MEFGDGVEVILTPSAAFTLGFPDGGGRHPMPVIMRLLFLIWDTAIQAMLPTHLISLTGRGG